MNITCIELKCNLFDDLSYCVTYFVVFLYFLFTINLLYTSIKFKTAVMTKLYTGALVAATTSTVSASTECFYYTGCQFKKSYTVYELTFQYLLLFFAIINVTINLARFNALHTTALPK